MHLNLADYNQNCEKVAELRENSSRSAHISSDFTTTVVKSVESAHFPVCNFILLNVVFIMTPATRLNADKPEKLFLIHFNHF